MDYDFTELESTGVLLRKVNIDDSDEIFKLLNSSNNATKHIPYSKNNNMEEIFSLVKKWENEYKEGMNYRWIIEDKNTRNILGIIYTTELDLENRIATIELIYPDYNINNRKLIESLELIFDYLFIKESFLIIKLYCGMGNKEMKNIIESLNMVFEGIEKNIFKNISNKKFEIMRYSIDKRRWLGRNCIKYK